MNDIKIKNESSTTKFMQIVDSIVKGIDSGEIKRNTRLPSITVFSKRYGISRDTVEKAYKKLVEKGYLIAIKGKGNYVLDRQDSRLRILLIFNKLSSYKKIIYDTFLETLGSNARVDLYIHHYNPDVLREIIDENLDCYNHYVIMPHFFHDVNEDDYLAVLNAIPADKLLLLDRNLNLDKEVSAVYQDFKSDIYIALKESIGLTQKYNRITVVFPKHSNHPIELNGGVMKFCLETEKQFEVVNSTQKELIKPGSAYILLTESDLAVLIKQCRQLGLQLGKDVGVLSFNETVLKELLDITVVTTDFEKMGRIAASLLLENRVDQVKNPFYMIQRNSL
ncbi:MAG TPA: GntR family transcriptional regulator [Pelobium sp.]|nr:GntR family transcriptional regulator [Pelobium sp.]